MAKKTNKATAPAPASALPENINLKEDLYSNPQAKKILDCCKNTLYNWRRDGLLPYYKVGSKIYYLKADVLALLNRNRYFSTGKKAA